MAGNINRDKWRNSPLLAADVSSFVRKAFFRLYSLTQLRSWKGARFCGMPLPLLLPLVLVLLMVHSVERAKNVHASGRHRSPSLTLSLSLFLTILSHPPSLPLSGVRSFFLLSEFKAACYVSVRK